MRAFVTFLFLAIMASTTQSRFLPYQTHLLMPSSDAPMPSPDDMNFKPIVHNCDNWRFAVESNNFRSRSPVPDACGVFVKDYMEGGQYESDCDIVVEEAIKYIDNLEKIEDNYIWIFDIDETALSNIEYYRRYTVAYGTKKYNSLKFHDWVESGKAKALKPVLRLYMYLVSKKVKIVFLTGVGEHFTEIRRKNLQDQGYTTMEKLILKSNEEKSSGSAFKSKIREKLETVEKYKIIGNIGDQWSDITGSYAGVRTFKVPNPMYYL